MNQVDERKVKIKKEKQINLMVVKEFKNYAIPTYVNKYLTSQYIYE